MFIDCQETISFCLLGMFVFRVRNVYPQDECLSSGLGMFVFRVRNVYPQDKCLSSGLGMFVLRVRNVYPQNECLSSGLGMFIVRVRNVYPQDIEHLVAGFGRVNSQYMIRLMGDKFNYSGNYDLMEFQRIFSNEIDIIHSPSSFTLSLNSVYSLRC